MHVQTVHTNVGTSLSKGGEMHLLVEVLHMQWRFVCPMHECVANTVKTTLKFLQCQQIRMERTCLPGSCACGGAL